MMINCCCCFSNKSHSPSSVVRSPRQSYFSLKAVKAPCWIAVWLQGGLSSLLLVAYNKRDMAIRNCPFCVSTGKKETMQQGKLGSYSLCSFSYMRTRSLIYNCTSHAARHCHCHCHVMLSSLHISAHRIGWERSLLAYCMAIVPWGESPDAPTPRCVAVWCGAGLVANGAVDDLPVRFHQDQLIFSCY